ncbi:MAG: phenylacetate--CoA ligase family protein [Candidatus Heimdallarchaeota archaeon]
MGFYREKWKSIEFNPNTDFNSLNDIVKIPPLTKEQIRANIPNLISKGFPEKELIKNYTGGSTGKSLTFYQTNESKDWSTAELFRHFNMCGWEFGDKYAFLWGADRDTQNIGMANKINQKIRRYIWMNSFKLSEEKLSDFTKRIKKFKPKLLIGYASSLFEFAKFLEKQKYEISIPFVESSAEKLYPFQRRKIQQYLNCKVFNRYGCREVGNIAHECSEYNKLHISEDINYIEILDKDNNLSAYEENGFVTITNLYNYGMPFIRYQNEDMAAISDEFCGCGRISRLLNPIIGRISDNIITPQGKIIHGKFFTHLFYNIPEVHQFQLPAKNLR